MLHDPDRMRSRAFGAGIAIGVLVIAGAVVLSFLRPAGDVSRETVMLGTESGAMYVRVDDRVHPVLNLASARLLVGAPDGPGRVRDSDLADSPRGPLVGIPGAPSVFPEPVGDAEANATTWTVCDESAATGTGAHPLVRTTVLAHPPEAGADGGSPGGGAPGGEGSGVEEVVLAEYSGRTWLIRDGTRARVDPSDTGLLETLGLGSAMPRRVSPALLNTLSEVTPLRPPEIPGSGEPVGYDLEGIRIGQIVLTDTAGGTEAFVALPDGIQPVGSAIADLIRATLTVGDATRLPPDRLADVPRSTSLDVSAYPSTAPHLADPSAYPVVCAEWSADHSARGRGPELRLGSTVPATGVDPVELTGDDGPGPRVDRVGLPGGGLLVTGVGAGPDPELRAPAATLLSDTGVRFDVPDAEAAEMLGLEGAHVPIPSGLLARLPSGPALSIDAAATIHDGLDPESGLTPELAPEGG